MKLSDLHLITNNLPRPDTLEEAVRFHEAIQELGLDPKNLYQELEMSSRFVDAHRDTSFSNTQVQLHSHTFFELIYCRNTCGTEYLAGTHRYRLQRGDIIFVPPGISHRPILPEHMSEPYKRYVLWFSPELVEYLTVLFPDDNFQDDIGIHLFRTAGTPWEFLGDYFRTGVQESEQQKTGWEASVLGNTMQLLVQLRRALADRSTTPLRAEKPELLDQILIYVEAHLADKLTLPDMATRFWISESTISQTFRQKMGVSFYRCVTQRRLIAAKSLILDGYPLDEVARRVGFADYSTFYRAFKQEYGINPRQYRKLQSTSNL